MTDTITHDSLEQRCENVNRRMESRSSIIRYTLEFSDRVGILRTNEEGTIVHDAVRYGTKAEMAEFLHAMMVALDDSARDYRDR